jgi:hypothetical protein
MIRVILYNLLLLYNMPPSKEEIVKELSKHFESDDVALHHFAEKLLGMKKEMNQNDMFIMKEFMDIYENELYDDDFNNVNDYIHDRIVEIDYKSHSKKKGGSSTKKRSSSTKKKSSSTKKKSSQSKKKRSSQSKKKKSK